MSWEVDHLVIGAATLEQGAAWCEATLGVAPAPGGKHPLMSTHNRLLAIGSVRFPRTYLEIIAIDPQAPPPGRPRWFDLDQPGMQRALAEQPMLIHWAARCADADAGCAALARAGFDRGAVLAVERDTPRGPLRWRISVRADGQRLCAGALPTLIEWGDAHPNDSLPASGVQLDELVLGGLPAGVTGLLPVQVRSIAAGAPLDVLLTTPRGPVRLVSLP